ncbi:MAG: FecR domain-containing protein [Chloroflexota bacterium]|nr:MAG: FecR domain-containing protein [Chloroflexota bacterium]
MSEELSRVLAECIEAIEQGRLTVDECLDAYPSYRVELSELLSVALGVRAVPAVYASPEFRQKARVQLLAKLPPRATDSNGRVSDHALSGTFVVWSALAQRLQSTRQRAALWWPGPSWPRPALAAAVVLLFVVILLSTLWLRGRSPATQESMVVQESPATPAMETMVSEAGTEATIEERPSEPGLAVADTSEKAVGVIPPDEDFQALMPFIAAPLNFNARTAAVEAVQGIVEVQNGEGEWLAVNQAAAVTEGQRVRTGAFSGATITFYDGSQASLGSNTEVSLDQVDALRPEDGIRTVVMTQWAGESEHFVDFRNDSGSRYEVRSTNGSGRARGTVFQVIVTPEHLTQYIVAEGRVDVTHLNVTVVVTAGHVSFVEPEEPPSQPYFTVSGQGEVTAMGETWTIGGQSFATTDGTVVTGDPQIGDIVSVYGYMLPDGTLVATHIILRHQTPVNHFSLTGLVESVGADEWTVAGRAIAVNDETVIDEAVVVGDLARVQGIILADDGLLLAQRIDRVDETLPFEFVGVVNSIAASVWNISGLDITVDANTVIEGDISVGDVVQVEGEIQADGAWLAHVIRLHDDDAEFEFTGLVDSIDPWQVSGISFETDAYTDIDGDIDVGDLVHVEGQILADGTWLATEIQLLSDDDLTFAFIGLVDSIDPWIVSGVSLTVDEDTIIDDDIMVGDLVRVRGIILSDGALLATLIERLDDDDDPAGCYTVTTIVLSLNGDQVTLKGLPPLTLYDDGLVDGDLTPNAIVTVSICLSGDGSITIISIVVVIAYVPPKPPGTKPPPEPGPGNGGNVTICHKPGTPAEQTKTVPRSALHGHLGHGDFHGPCR